MNSRIVAAALLTVASAACTTNDRNSGLIVARVITGTFTPATATTAATCTLNAGAPEEFLPDFNPGIANQSALTGFVVQNQLINPTTINAQLNTNSTTFTPHQAVIDYEIIGGATVPRQIVPVSSGTVQSGTLTTVAVPLFAPAAVRAALTADGFVRTTTRIEGKLDDGSTASTSAHDFLIHVCPTCAATNPCF